MSYCTSWFWSLLPDGPPKSELNLDFASYFFFSSYWIPYICLFNKTFTKTNLSFNSMFSRIVCFSILETKVFDNIAEVLYATVDGDYDERISVIFSYKLFDVKVFLNFSKDAFSFLNSSESKSFLSSLVSSSWNTVMSHFIRTLPGLY